MRSLANLSPGKSEAQVIEEAAPDANSGASTVASLPLKLPAPSSELKAFALAGLFHVAVFASLGFRYEGDKPPVPIGIPIDIAFVEAPGAPPPGSPDGSLSPSPAPPPPELETVNEPTEAFDAQDASEQPALDAPHADPAASPPDHKVAPLASSAPSWPSMELGSGALALGAQSRGSASGASPEIAEAISRSVASRIRTCWTPPKGNVPIDTNSTIVARFNIDGTLNGEPQVVRLVGETEERVASPNGWEADAIGAIKRCSPLGLAQGLYPYWSEVSIQIFGPPSPKQPS